MEDKPNIPGLTQETEQQSIQRRTNRPRRQPGGVPDDQHTAEMRAVRAEGASVAIATATDQLAPMTVLDNGDDGIIIEDFKALQEAAKSLTGSTKDTPAGALAKGLVSAREEKQADVRIVKTEIRQIQREKDQTQTTLKTLEDQLSELRKDRVFKACKKQQRKWWHRFCLCGGVENNNKVGVAPDENCQTQDWETHFADQLAKQGSTIRSLQKDKAILERQIFKLKDGSEAANRIVKEMSQKNKEMANGRKEAEKEKKQAEKEKKAAEGGKAKAEIEKVKAEKEKEKAEKLMKEMEKKMKLEEKKRRYVERLNQVLLEKLCHMQQDIAQKTDDIAQKTDDIALNTQMTALKDKQISQLKGINDKLQEITNLRLMREAKTNVDRVVIACLNFVSPQELAIQDLMSFNHSSASGQTILGFVGKGGYGEVMLGRLNGEKDPVAIKRALVKQNLTAELEESDRKRRNVRYEKEARAGLMMSTSPYFPRFVGTVMINGDHCLVTEFIGDKIQGKSYVLYDAIIPRKGRDPEPDVQKWNLVAIGEDIIRGVMALHGRSLLHNDIKDDNVLLEFRKNRWVAVIIDLGMVSTATYPYFSGSNGSMSTHAKGYFIHTAPEVLKGCETSVASDVYSVGIILDCIGGFIKDDGLRTLGDMCCKEDPKNRPGDMEEMLPGVVDIKERHRTVARLAGELLEADTAEEQEEEDFLTDLSETGTEEEAEGEMKEGDAEVEDERGQEGLEEEAGEEGQVEEEGDDAWLLHIEGEEPNEEEVQRGAAEEGVAEENSGEARRHQEVGDEVEEGDREEGNEAGDGEAEQGDAGEGVAGEEAPQVHQQVRNEEGPELAVEAVHPNAEEAAQGGEELMLEDGEEGANEERGERNDGEVIEEDDGIG